MEDIVAATGRTSTFANEANVEQPEMLSVRRKHATCSNRPAGGEDAGISHARWRDRLSRDAGCIECTEGRPFSGHHGTSIGGFELRPGISWRAPHGRLHLYP